MRKYLNASVVNMIQTCYKNPTDLKLSLCHRISFDLDTPMNLRLQKENTVSSLHVHTA